VPNGSPQLSGFYSLEYNISFLLGFFSLSFIVIAARKIIVFVILLYCNLRKVFTM
jgi:hypothetical protein